MPNCWTKKKNQLNAHWTLFLVLITCAISYSPIESMANIGQGRPVEEKSRLEFRQAIKALEVGDYDRFKQLADRNRDYLLYPYLHYYDLKARLSSATMSSRRLCTRGARRSWGSLCGWQPKGSARRSVFRVRLRTATAW